MRIASCGRVDSYRLRPGARNNHQEYSVPWTTGFSACIGVSPSFWSPSVSEAACATLAWRKAGAQYQEAIRSFCIVFSFVVFPRGGLARDDACSQKPPHVSIDGRVGNIFQRNSAGFLDPHRTVNDTVRVSRASVSHWHYRRGLDLNSMTRIDLLEALLYFPNQTVARMNSTHCAS